MVRCCSARGWTCANSCASSWRRCVTLCRWPSPCASSSHSSPRSCLAPGRRVLRVDDDPMLRDLAPRMLERLGYSGLGAESGAESGAELGAQALDPLAVNAVRVSMRLTDLTMGGLSGMALIDQVKRRLPAALAAVRAHAVHGGCAACGARSGAGCRAIACVVAVTTTAAALRPPSARHDTRDSGLRTCRRHQP